VQHVPTGHMICTARVDMPEFHLEAGESFQLFESGYSDESGASYAYIVGIDGCSCKGHEHRHSCQHSPEASRVHVARLHLRQQTWREDDELAHVEDSLVAGEFEREAARIIERLQAEEQRASAPLFVGRRKFEIGPNGYAVPMAS